MQKIEVGEYFPFSSKCLSIWERHLDEKYVQKIGENIQSRVLGILVRGVIQRKSLLWENADRWIETKEG